MRVQMTPPRYAHTQLSNDTSQKVAVAHSSTVNAQPSRFGIRTANLARSVFGGGIVFGAIGSFFAGITWGVRSLNGALRSKGAINKYLQTGEKSLLIGIPKWAKTVRAQMVTHGQMAERGAEVALTTAGAGTGMGAATVYAASRELPAGQTMALQATSGAVGAGAGYALAQKVKQRASDVVKRWYLNTWKP